MINQNKYGYYSITLRKANDTPLLRSNDERAFVIAQLQDMLSHRLAIQELPDYTQFASCIDLLCFMINRRSINLLIFAIDHTFVTLLAEKLKDRLVAQQTEQFSPVMHTNANLSVSIRQLAGPHTALTESIRIHQLSTDWEYDRYSSIGFYLHDRRGDWMRIWRLTKLYDNDPANYRSMLITTPVLGSC
ncbi:hypothetical protein BGO18_04230 [Candidatus Saccharibacteria bacterium 47-87]|nr:hypothetical protein [Candidatus Saccharibacteria bacterium]OJU97340.1 MAG: hypothetical protein BGO18_04230 [Candidatus Saccharibacteria bacterium 47-87]